MEHEPGRVSPTKCGAAMTEPVIGTLFTETSTSWRPHGFSRNVNRYVRWRRKRFVSRRASRLFQALPINVPNRWSIRLRLRPHTAKT